MKCVVHAEWTKLRSVAGPAWLLLGTIALTVALSAGAVAAASPGSTHDLTKLSLTGVQLGQVVVAVLAVLLISGEYGTGMIRTTLTAMPGRLTVYIAKAAVLVAVVFVAGAVAVLASLLAGRMILPARGFTADRDYPLLSLAHESTLRATFGSVLYLALIALLALGVGTAVRDAATAVGLVLALLFLFPVVAQVVDAHWQRHLNQVAPMTAGLDIQATTGLRGLPLTPWQGLGVLGAWTVGALAVGGALLRLRDA